MKKIIITLFSFTFILFTNCKESKKETSNTEIKIEEVQEDYFTFIINAIIENDDTFTLFYLEGEEKNITDENSVSIDVYGNPNQQTLEFRLTEDVLPTRLILRYGTLESSQKIQFIDSKLSYYDEEILIAGNKFYQFFIPNKFIEFNQEEQTAISEKKDGKEGPIFYSRKVLEDKIDFFFY